MPSDLKVFKGKSRAAGATRWITPITMVPQVPPFTRGEMMSFYLRAVAMKTAAKGRM